MIKKFKKGFTLIELLVVVAIIGILAGLVIVSVASARRKANNAKVKNDIAQVMNAAELHLSSSSGGVFSGAAANVTTAAPLTGPSGTAGHVQSFLDDSLTQIMKVAPVHPVSSSNYTWEVNGTNNAYIICGALVGEPAASDVWVGQDGATFVAADCPTYP